ncbi:hypothetical protein E3N88_37902 [Mikania micrantha]|uniref:S-acyltransferase n=1 Tax=Mikania micrantha TaxID=192012 RepID=A0A5N6LTA6_9ASTR|nr:hypothetical protein E3N88_37902 [Mikania micrantha]
MDSMDPSTVTLPSPPPPPPSSASAPGSTLQEDHYIASITEEHEVTCWGCGLILILSPYTPIFKCGWCGAITNHNAVKGGGIWAIYPIVFSISHFCGIVHISTSIILSITTISTYILSAFRSPGAPPLIPWGSYPAVRKGGLEGYTFCNYCSKPKSPNSHHCRSCGMCVLDMDHHCPFIGNCVGAANHRVFIFFLISAVMSNFYVAVISLFAAYYIWPPTRSLPISILSGPADYMLIYGYLKEIAFSFFTSVESLSLREIPLNMEMCWKLWHVLQEGHSGQANIITSVNRGLEQHDQTGLRGRSLSNDKVIVM